jgi:hypothetical protein
VRESAECPVNDILISNQNRASVESQYSVDLSNYKSFDLDSGYTLYFSSSSTNLPIVRMKIEQGGVCTDPLEHDRSKGRSGYILLKDGNYRGCSTKIGGDYKDPRHFNVSSIIEERLYDDNGVSPIIKRLKDYPVSDSARYYWNLHKNSYYYWNPECDNYGTISRDYVMKLIDQSSDVTGAQKGLMVICIVNFIIIMILECIAC